MGLSLDLLICVLELFLLLWGQNWWAAHRPGYTWPTDGSWLASTQCYVSFGSDFKPLQLSADPTNLCHQVTQGITYLPSIGRHGVSAAPSPPSLQFFVLPKEKNFTQE